MSWLATRNMVATEDCQVYELQLPVRRSAVREASLPVPGCDRERSLERTGGDGTDAYVAAQYGVSSEVAWRMHDKRAPQVSCSLARTPASNIGHHQANDAKHSCAITPGPTPHAIFPEYPLTHRPLSNQYTCGSLLCHLTAGGIPGYTRIPGCTTSGEGCSS